MLKRKVFTDLEIVEIKRLTEQWLVDECSSESPNQAQAMKNLEFSSITVPTDDTLESLSPSTLPVLSVEQLQLKTELFVWSQS